VCRPAREGPILIITQAIDPVVRAFIDCASENGLAVWMPSRLEDMSWTLHQTSDQSFVEVSDSKTGNHWTDETLSGVWYRSLPDSSLSARFDEADQSYIAAEVMSSFTAAWLRSRCPFVGIVPILDSGLADAGLEARAELRSLKLRTVADHVGTLRHLAATIDHDPDDVWITGVDHSGWLAALMADTDETRSDGHPDEIVAASPTDRRQRCAAIFVDSALRVVLLDIHSTVICPSDEMTSAVESARGAARLRVGVCYFARSGDGWSIVKVSPHVPTWLDASSTAWVAAHLCDFFQTAALSTEASPA
jgi:hypothetical protein